MDQKVIKETVEKEDWQLLATAVTNKQLDQNGLNYGLWQICGHYQPALVALLLENGAIPNTHNQAGESPLHRAALAWDAPAVALLLAAAANVHAKTSRLHYTPLHEAVRLPDDTLLVPPRTAPEADRLATVRHLLTAGADPNTPTHKPAVLRHSVFGRRYEPYVWRPFPYAVGHNLRPLAELLWEFGADINLPGCMAYPQITAVYAALQNSYFSNYTNEGLFDWLMALQANLNSDSYYHPLRLAVEEADEVNAVRLLQAGADPDLCLALHKAIQEGELEIATLCLQHGANVALPDSYGATPLYYAAAQPEMLQLLLAHGANLLTPLYHRYYFPDGTDLLRAAQKQKASAAWLETVTDLLLTQQQVGDNHQQLLNQMLLWAAQGQINSSCDHWLALGAGASVQDAHGRTALHHLVRRQAWEEAEALCRAGAVLDVADSWGYTPLHEAVARQEETAVYFLLAQGANVNVASRYGFTPLHLAARAGDVALAQQLLAAGADPTARLSDGRCVGWTALDTAVAYAQEPIITLLTPISPPAQTTAGQHALTGPYRVVQAYDSWPHPAQIEPASGQCPQCGEPMLYNTGYTAEGSGYDAERIELFQCGNCRTKWWQTMSAREYREWSKLGHFIDGRFPRDPFPGDFAR